MNSRPPFHTLCLSLCFGCMALLPLSSEAWFFGKAGMESSTFLEPSDWEDSELGAELFFYPGFQAYGDQYEFNLRGEFLFSDWEETPDISLLDFSLTLFLGDTLTVSAGQFDYTPGAASLLAPLNFYQSIRYDRLLEGKEEALTQSPGLLQLSWFGDGFYLKATGQFAKSPWTFISEDSPWFPYNQFPDSVTFGFETIDLGEVVIEEVSDELVLSDLIEDFSGSLEFGTGSDRADLSLMGYYGYANTPQFLVDTKFPGGLTEPFQLNLTPVYPKNGGVGASFSFDASPFLLYADGAFIFNRVYEVDEDTEDNITYERAPWGQAAVGTILFLDELGLTAVLEYDRSSYNSSEAVETSFLDNLLFLSLNWLSPEERFQISLMSILELNLYGSVHTLTFLWNLDHDLTFKLYTPVFLGDGESDLGQFADSHFVSLSLSWIF